MRSLLHFACVMLIGAVLAIAIHALIPSFTAGYITGLGVMITAALVLNSRPPRGEAL